MAIASPLEALSSDDSDSDDDATIVSPVDVLPTDDLIDDESIGAVVDDGGARLQAQPLYFVVVPGENPAYPPIFDRIEEYETYAEMWKLIADDSAVGKRSVIYASTVLTLYDIKEMLVAYAVENGTLDSIADVSLIASQTGAEEVTCALEYWRGGLSPVAGCTIRLGAGVNLDTPNMFDTAYLFLHMSKGTADLTDMVQLSARVRSIVSRTLRYAVTSSNFGTNLHGDVTKRGQLKEAVSRVDPCLSRLYKYHDRRFLTKRFCASSLMYAKITARTMLVAAYSTRTDVPYECQEADTLVMRKIHESNRTAAVGYRPPLYVRSHSSVGANVAKIRRVNRRALKAFKETTMVDEKTMGKRKRLCTARVPSSKRSRLEPLIFPIGSLVENHDGANSPTETMTLVATGTRFCGKKIDQELMEGVVKDAESETSGSEPRYATMSTPRPVPDGVGNDSDSGDDGSDDSSDSSDDEGQVYPEDITDFDFAI